MDKAKIGRSPAPRVVPLPKSGKPPLYRIKIPGNFKDLLVGATLGGRYWVLSVIGKGGMSVVYRAKTKDTGRVVAVKTLRTQGLTDEMLVKRFQREAELLSRLNHPRIVNLHAYGTSARGQPYFVMDFLQGENLTDVLKNEDHLTPERFQDIFVQVCAAIEHAHRHNAIHRDIKPGNIMLTRVGKTTDYVKIVDFGIAMVSEEAQRLTRMGEVWGSPIYMSPEQCMGATVDLRSDIYSLGIVMFESLTGRVPFLGRNYADTMGKQISEPPPRMVDARPDLVIPEPFEKIIHKALGKLPEDRYQSLTEMRKDLEAALSYDVKQSKSKISDSSANLKARKKTQELQEPKIAAKAPLRSQSRPAPKVVPEDDDEPRAPVRKTASRTNLKAVSKKGRTTLQRAKKAASREKEKSKLPLVIALSLAGSIFLIFCLTQKQIISRVLADIARVMLRSETEYTSPYMDLPQEDKTPVIPAKPGSQMGRPGLKNLFDNGGAAETSGADETPQEETPQESETQPETAPEESEQTTTD